MPSLMSFKYSVLMLCFIALTILCAGCKKDDPRDGPASTLVITKIVVKSFPEMLYNYIEWDDNNGKADLYVEVHDYGNYSYETLAWRSDVVPDANYYSEYEFTPPGPIVLGTSSLKTTTYLISAWDKDHTNPQLVDDQVGFIGLEVAQYLDSKPAVISLTDEYTYFEIHVQYAY